MRVSLFDMEHWDESKMQELLDGHEVQVFYNPLQEENLEDAKDTEAACFFISSKVGREQLEQLPNLKLLCTMSTGFDHIDLEACKERDIKVCNVPHYGENTVAEHAFSLILALARNLYPSIKRTHEEHEFHTDEALRGFDLKDKTLGIIGCGSIGKHVARIAKGFQMKMLVFDVIKDEFLAEELGFEYVDMETLFRGSDIITLHVPYMEKTHHLINADAISKMKDGVFIINTARGPLIDTKALVNGIESGKIGGAGLDVLEWEHTIDEEAELLEGEDTDISTLLRNHVLMKKDNVIITPHNAFNSKEALQRIIETTVNNINDFSAGDAQNVVD